MQYTVGIIIRKYPDLTNICLWRRSMKKIVFLLLTALFLTVNVALAAVNINTADKEALVALSGIGDKKAAAIVQYRKDHGEFKNPQDLLAVKGIGPKVLEKLIKDVTVK
jgi:competence protein ComEA